MTVLNSIVIIIFLILIAISQILTYIKENKKETTVERKKYTIDEFCNKNYKKIWLLFIVIIFISVIYKFGELPIYIGVDEAGMAYDAMSIEKYGVDRYLNSYPLYLTSFGSGQSVLCGYLAVLFMKMFGVNVVSYRLPVLLVYILGTVASYLFVSKSENKKMALLFTFLIITCPWNIMNARQALDCNLYAGMLMIDLFLMNRAKKNYQYIIAGIAVGVTLYTYSLTWISIPIFLFVWIIYMLYLKRINWKQIILFGIPIAIFALPLIYFLLLNYGIVEQSKIGIFTVPKLWSFGGGEIAISNIWTKGLNNLKTIFLSRNTIYIPYVLLFGIGYVISIIKTVKQIKNKEYSVTGIMTIAFTTILVGLLLVNIPTANKANALYIPILYFVSVAILEICKNWRVLFIIEILLVAILWINFEYKYYTKYAYEPTYLWYEDTCFGNLSKKLEQNDETKELEKHVMVFRTSPYIYQILANEMSPYEYNENKESKNYGNALETTRVGNYYYYNYFYNKEEIFEKSKKSENAIIIISEEFSDIVNLFENENYIKYEYEELYVLVNQNSKIEIENVIK